LQAPENWQPTPSDLAQQERQALEALVGAGLVERRITFAVRLPGQTEQATISIEVTGEFGLAEAMEAAVQDLWLRWGERWAELHKQIDTPRPIVEVQENLWRLTADGESAQTDLGGTPEDRQRVIDFVLKRGFFDGTPKRLPDGRITRRQPVRGYGRLLRCQIENAPSGPVGVQVANWAEGAEAFAQAFERLFQAFTPPAKESPAAAAPEAGGKQSAAPAASAPETQATSEAEPKSGKRRYRPETWERVIQFFTQLGQEKISAIVEAIESTRKTEDCLQRLWELGIDLRPYKAEEIASLLGCHKTTVIKTDWWKKRMGKE